MRTLSATCAPTVRSLGWLKARPHVIAVYTLALGCEAGGLGPQFLDPAVY
jgi:hypothetical protein